MTRNSAKQWISGLAVRADVGRRRRGSPSTYFGQDAGANADGGAEIATHPVFGRGVKPVSLAPYRRFTTQTFSKGIGNNTPTPIIIPGFGFHNCRCSGKRCHGGGQ